MGALLAYTLTQLMTQQAVLERDMAPQDAFGAQSTPDWQPLATVPCRAWWDRSSGARSANREYVTDARQVPVSVGGLMIPSGTDVTEEDRIVQLNNADGSLLIDGIFKIVAVLNEWTHLELDVLRTHLGA